MGGRIWHFSLEFFFVLICIFILKTWVFPFFISIWFPISDMTELLHEWTLLMVGVITLFAYVGLGSTAKWSYHLNWKVSSALFCFYHLPLFVLPWTWSQQMQSDWTYLVGELFVLFGFREWDSPFSIFIVSWVAFLFGRWMKIKEKDEQGGRLVSRHKVFVQK
ncbi:hypothetical protein [Baia soyae]|uniref:Uncharacterized protein n=1 Tax=Baia soyae TaxID=1544746 RepID=A0A4R2SD97_9BACL|nr:hypothetical protein [Baia soyae]TCP69085.1 hypothetical protein EDD57_1137 [Baia soyae]